MEPDNALIYGYICGRDFKNLHLWSIAQADPESVQRTHAFLPRNQAGLTGDWRNGNLVQ